MSRRTLGSIKPKQADVITTRGDLVRGDSSGNAERLALGAADTFVGSDGTDTLSVAAATQAEQETGSATNKPVTSGRQHYHQSAVKGWVKSNFDASADASYNVSSVTDIGTGQIGVNWDTDFSSGDYAVVATAKIDPAGSTASTIIAQIRDTGFAAGVSRIDSIRVSDGTSVDATELMVAALGDQ